MPLGPQEPDEIGEWVSSAELAGLLVEPLARADDRTTTEKLVDYLFVIFVRAGVPLRADLPVDRQLMTIEPDARIVLAEFFEAQRVADVAADVSQPPWRRETAARLLDAGSREMFHLCVDGRSTRLGETTYLIVRAQKQAGRLAHAIDSLRLFTGMDRRFCVRAVRDCFSLTDAPAEGGRQ